MGAPPGGSLGDRMMSKLGNTNGPPAKAGRGKK
jgi:hypothetical protein